MVVVYNVVLALILYFSLLYCFLKNQQYKKFFFILFFLILGCVSAFRYEILFSDFIRYTYHTLDSYRIPWANIFDSTEFLNIAFQKIVMILFKDPQYYFILSGFFISFSFLLVGYLFANNLALYVFLFYTMFTYFFMHNATRQGIAAAFLSFSFVCLFKRKKIAFWLFVIIASLFHQSSLVFSIIFFLRKIPITKKSLIAYSILLTGCVIFFPLFMNFVQMFAYAEYVDDTFGMTPAKIYNIISAIPIFLALWLDLKNQAKYNVCILPNLDENRNALIHGSLIYCLFIILCCSRAAIFMRMANIFSLFPMIFIVNSLCRIDDEKKKNALLCLLYLLGLAIFFICNYNGKLFPSPYYFYWEISTRPIMVV